VIATLTWKEYREQSTIWVALAALGVVALAGLTAVLAPQGAAAAGPDQAVLLLVAATGLALTCGLVCGAQTLAGEAEGGTLPFLDTQPVLRRQVWAAKLVAGLSLTLLQGLLLGGVAAWLGLRGGLSWSWSHGGLSRWDWFWALPAVALEAYCWGLLGSALCKNVLVAVVVAAVLVMGPWLLVTPPSWQEEPLVLLVRAGLALAALTISVLVFTRPDRERRPARARTARRRSAADRPSDAVVLLWLAARQGRGWLLALAVAAFVSALLLAGYGPVFWPVLTLVVGVVCGSTAFLAEQSEGTYWFLGEQRLPPGRVWLWKTGFWLAAAGAVSVLVLLAGGFHAGIVAAHAPAEGHSGGDGRWLFLVPPLAAAGLWLLYGFSIAQTCSLVWRRSAAALFMALVLSAAVSSAWAPSLLAGGLASWRVFVVPALLLAFNALVMRAWLDGRFYTWRPLAGLALCVALTAAWIAGCLWYRVAEVPAAGECLDIQAFVASLPPPEQNQAGSLIRQAMTRLKEQEGRAASAVNPPQPPRPPLPAAPDPAPPAPAAPDDYPNRAQQVVENGWTGTDQELDRFFDALFQEGWADPLRQVTGLPLGMIVDPRQVTVSSNLDVAQQCRWAGILLTARGLQLQARGDDGAGLDHLLTALALSRQMRSRAVPFAWMVGVSVEQAALKGLDHWLERVGPRPKLLRRALGELGRHEEALPLPSDPVLADYLTLQSLLDEPSQLLRSSSGADRSQAARVTQELLGAAWQAPWEKARAERILRATTAGRLRGVEAGYAAIGARRQADGFPPPSQGEQALEGWLAADDGPGGAATRRRLARLIWHSWLAEAPMFTPNLPLAQAAGLCRVRGARLQLALALYQATEGRPAAALDDLVPRYLPVLPRDPFSPEGQGFSYRLSEGEDLEWGPQFPADNQRVRHVAAGEGIVWSDGVDLTDNGGHRQGMTRVPGGPQLTPLGADWIFVVPRRAER
jgi:hypothetical protein